MNFIDGKELSIDKFLEVLLSKYSVILVPNNHFPTDEMLNEFLATIEQRSDTEIKEILAAFFIKNGTFNIDLVYKEFYKKIDSQDNEFAEQYKIFSSTQYFKRLMSHQDQTDTVWEGITWVIDLLPHFPNDALRGLSAYFLANCQFLPDSYHIGFGDWAAIIRAKYVDTKVSQEFFLNLLPKEFEYIVAELYEKMGYETKLTNTSHDGGIDIYAEKKKTGKKEKLLIQCKRYRKNIVVDEARKLLGVVADKKATKGTLVTCSDFTRPAIKFSNSNPQIELINMRELTRLLNLHLGPLWTIKADRYFMNQKRKSK